MATQHRALGPMVHTAIRVCMAAVWLGYGLVAKILGAVPRHRLIVARFVGEAWSGPFTLAVGLAEVLMALWVLSGRHLRWFALTQTLAVLTMNSLELWKARDLLLAPIPMVLFNAVLLTSAWYTALSAETRRG